MLDSSLSFADSAQRKPCRFRPAGGQILLTNELNDLADRAHPDLKGAIIGGTLAETVAHNDFIATVREYGNFDLRLKVKLEGSGFVNGGVQIRSQRAQEPAYEMVGYQADMGDGYWGCLYDESRRNKPLVTPAPEVIKRLLKPNDWNEYVIRCEGRRIRLWLNGELTADYLETDEAIPLTGKIGLQIHGGGKTEASYKDINIAELP